MPKHKDSVYLLKLSNKGVCAERDFPLRHGIQSGMENSINFSGIGIIDQNSGIVIKKIHTSRSNTLSIHSVKLYKSDGTLIEVCVGKEAHFHIRVYKVLFSSMRACECLTPLLKYVSKTFSP